jgi:hypothetical protein
MTTEPLTLYNLVVRDDLGARLLETYPQPFGPCYLDYNRYSRAARMSLDIEPTPFAWRWIDSGAKES